MKEKNNQPSERDYRVVQIEGKITWQVEELWDGGVVRGPFGARDFAIRQEENIARAEGFINDLVLKEVVGKEKSPRDCFEKDSDGKWHCTDAISLDMEGRMIIITKGMKFTKGIPFMMVDVAKWLDENCS